MYKYPLISPLFFIIINMLKSPLPDKLLIKINTARRAHKSGRPILEHLTDDKELSEVLATNLARSYRQRYNHHLAQLHYIGTCIKLYQEKGNSNTEVRRILGITRKQFYSALATSKAIKDRDIILYLEDVSPADFDKLSGRDLLYNRNGAGPEAQKSEEKMHQPKLKKTAKAIKDLFTPEPSSEKAQKPHKH